MSDFSHKFAETKYPVLPAIKERWSPYVFAERAVEPGKLRSCLEAARWSASSFNEQPWRFIVATRDNPAQFQKALGCLIEANQAWAKHAGVLLLTMYATNFTYNGKPNRVAFHDVGLAAGNLSIQAHELGLHVHQMAGVDAEKIRTTYQVPAEFEIGTAIAIGYAGTAGSDELSKRDLAPRSRKDFAEFVFADTWENPAPM
jgi:nitroreductase